MAMLSISSPFLHINACFNFRNKSSSFTCPSSRIHNRSKIQSVQFSLATYGKSKHAPTGEKTIKTTSRPHTILMEEINTKGTNNMQDGYSKGGYFRIEASKWHKVSPPLVSALKSAAEDNAASFMFPGHNRGQVAPLSLTQVIGETPFLHDLAELDNLTNPEGPLLEAQKQAAQVFGASRTWFLVGGTTCGIHAAIMGVCSPGETLILARNSHKSVTPPMVFSGLIPHYIIPNYDYDWDIPIAISPLQGKKAIEDFDSKGKKPGAVFITSPTYHGICSNIKAISDLCHLHGIPLIVDEAHGAHFGFHPSLPSSALEQGADVVIQSTHKVLFSLTQSSMLHASCSSLIDEKKISMCLESLQSTSPSYLLLASLDATTTQLRENAETIFDNAIKLAMKAKMSLKQIPGIRVLESPCIDPLRVTVGVYDLGLSGYQVDDLLYNDQKVISELPGLRFITFPFTPGTSAEHVDRLILGFKNLSSSQSTIQHHKKGTPRVDFTPWNDISMKLTPREAFFAKKTKVDIENAVGKVCAELICPFPPGIPIMFPGEVISERVIEMLWQSKANGAKMLGASDPFLSSMLVCDA